MSHSTAPHVPGGRCGQTCESRSCIRDSQPWIGSRHSAKQTFVPTRHSPLWSPGAAPCPARDGRIARRLLTPTYNIVETTACALRQAPLRRTQGHRRLLSSGPRRDYRWRRTLLRRAEHAKDSAFILRLTRLRTWVLAMRCRGAISPTTTAVTAPTDLHACVYAALAGRSYSREDVVRSCCKKPQFGALRGLGRLQGVN